MANRLPTKFANRDQAARKVASALKYKIAPGCAFESFTAFADAIGLPDDGTIPHVLRVRIEDYLAPPLEPERETHFTHSHYEEENA